MRLNPWSLVAFLIARDTSSSILKRKPESILKPIILNKIGKLNSGGDYGTDKGVLRLHMFLSPTSSRIPSFLRRKFISELPSNAVKFVDFRVGRLYKVEPDINHSQLSLDDLAGADTEHSVTFGQSLLALNKVPRLGRKGIRALVEKFGDALSQIWTYKPEQLVQILSAARIASSQEVAYCIYEERKELLKQGKNEVAYLGMKNRCILAPSELPPRLRDMRQPPLWLFVEGETHPLYHEPAIAVVGTRKASDLGREAAAVVSQILAAYPVTLVSGLADGIDNEAHLSSMREGVTNIAFLGHGIDHVFPASTSETRKQIVSSGGTVVTEYLPGERYRGSYFVERNRLQAALASLVIPVEANPRGGTAHTVRFAGELQRRLIGIRWDGANGILEQLAQDNVPIVDIFKLEGERRLDQFIRQLSEQAGHRTNALSLAIRILKRETERRFFREEDLQLLKQIVEQESSETASEEDDA